MDSQDAVKLISPGVKGSGEKQHWLDLGAGSGLFTRALAGLLTRGSVVTAVDKKRSLQDIESPDDVSIQMVVADFTRTIPVRQNVDGVVMANALHFVRDKEKFVHDLKIVLKTSGTWIVVEYDIDRRTPWVPYPVSYASLEHSASDWGATCIRRIGSYHSRYVRSGMYAAVIHFG